MKYATSIPSGAPLRDPWGTTLLGYDATRDLVGPELAETLYRTGFELRGFANATPTLAEDLTAKGLVLSVTDEPRTLRLPPQTDEERQRPRLAVFTRTL